MADSGTPEPQGLKSEDNTPTLNAATAPQRVEVVVESPSSSQGEVNILAELAIFVLRVGVSVMMVHHGLEKFQDPQGFSEFVVGKYFGFLPGDPIVWTFTAGHQASRCIPEGYRLQPATAPLRGATPSGFAGAFIFTRASWNKDSMIK